MTPPIKAALPEALDRLVEATGLPVPIALDLEPDPVVLTVASADDVAAWAACMRVAVARRTLVAGAGRGSTFALIHLVGVLVRVEHIEN